MLRGGSFFKEKEGDISFYFQSLARISTYPNTEIASHTRMAITTTTTMNKYVHGNMKTQEDAVEKFESAMKRE